MRPLLFELSAAPGLAERLARRLAADLGRLDRRHFPDGESYARYETPVDGRRGIGTTNHCVHGAGVSLEEVLDWRPFDYFTLRNTMPGMGSWVTTEELAETEDGRTHVTIRFQRPRAAKERAWMDQALPTMLPRYDASLVRLAELMQHVGTELAPAG